MIDHDRLFKELLTTFFGEFIDLFLPAMTAYLNKSSIVFLDKEIFTDVTAGDSHEVDLIVKARFRDSESFFLVHVETQAQNRNLSEFGRRMFSYFSRLHLKFALPVYPVVLFSFNRPTTEQSNMYEVSFPERNILTFNYDVIQLNRLDWRKFVTNPNPAAAALMSTMMIASEDRIPVKLECLRMLATLKLNRARMKLISGFIDTYLRLSLEETKVLMQKIDAMEPEEREAVMEIVTSWMEEGIRKGLEQGLEQGLEKGLEKGREQGLAQGLEKGREQGLAQGLEQGREHGRYLEAQSLIIRLLSRRIGQIDEAGLLLVNDLSLAKLEELSEALLDFSSEADLKKWLADNSG